MKIVLLVILSLSVVGCRFDSVDGGFSAVSKFTKCNGANRVSMYRDCSDEEAGTGIDVYR
jgi:hypothetical protein